MTYYTELAAENARLRAALENFDARYGHFANVPVVDDMAMLNILGDMARHVRAALRFPAAQSGEHHYHVSQPTVAPTGGDLLRGETTDRRKAPADATPETDVRSEICDIISKMLDNPQDCGIYPTTQCYDDLAAMVKRRLRAAKQERDEAKQHKGYVTKLAYDCMEANYTLWWRRATAAEARLQPEALRAVLTEIIRNVAELPDRNSPEDQPEMMLVTGAELSEIVVTALCGEGK